MHEMCQHYSTVRYIIEFYPKDLLSVSLRKMNVN